MTRGALNHVELRVTNLGRARSSWGWLLTELGYTPFQDWPEGFSLALGETYIVFELADGVHDRRRPGLSHLAFHAGSREDVDALSAAAIEHGWLPLYSEQYPHAGGADHYAAYLENADRFKVELVAASAG